VDGSTAIGVTIKLADVDADATPDAPGDRAKTEEKSAELGEQLANLQERLYAEARQSLLVVFQAMDTGGKDGAVKHVFRGVNPVGVHVASFKAPTPIELAHDFLWRVHQKTPAKGDIVIFNRSHYESVLIERVHELVPKKTWKRRYAQINDFEEMLVAEGTTIVKFFFHISRAEQRERLLARLDNPDKRWKFNPEDVAERKLWDDYMDAYQDAINKTSTKHAPWHVVPANHKWYRNYVVSKTLVDTLRTMDPQYPTRDLSGVDPSDI
jgi:PPK2 family polyphosphate:nucleotide phosphotransferase